MMSMVYDHYNTVMYNTVMLILVIHVRNENYFYYGGGGGGGRGWGKIPK